MPPEKQGAGQHPYKCLCCGHDYTEFFDPEAFLIERACPVCRSNSVRRLKKAPVKKAPDKQDDGDE